MELIDYVFGPYSEYKTYEIILECTAIIASVFSVIASLRNRTAVFPLGILSTLIYTYLLWHWNLLGDMIINMYYFVMSVYGWYIWTLKNDSQKVTPITTTTKREWKIASIIIFLSAAAVYIIYIFNQTLENIVSYIDMITTGIFFAGMWLMARRKIEHWLVLLFGNIISVPLYFYKGYALTAILFIFLSFMAYFGFIAWKKLIHNTGFTVKK